MRVARPVESSLAITDGLSSLETLGSPHPGWPCYVHVGICKSKRRYDQYCYHHDWGGHVNAPRMLRQVMAPRDLDYCACRRYRCAMYPVRHMVHAPEPRSSGSEPADT